MPNHAAPRSTLPGQRQLPPRDASGKFVKRAAPAAAAHEPSPNETPPAATAEPAATAAAESTETANVPTATAEPAPVVECQPSTSDALEAAQHDLAGARAALAEREREAQDLAATIRAHEARLAELEAEPAPAGGDRIARLEARLEAAIGQRDDEIRALKGRLEAAVKGPREETVDVAPEQASAEAELGDEVERLRSELASAQATLGLQEQELAALEEAAGLEKEVQALRARVRELEAPVAASVGGESGASSGRTLKASVDAIRATLEESVASLQTREAEVGKLQERLDGALALVEEREGELAASQRSLEAAREIVSAREQEIVVLRGSAARAQKGLAARALEFEALGEKLERAQENLTERDEQIARLRASLSAAEKARTAQDDEAAALRTSVARHEQEAARHDERVARLEEEIEAGRQTISARDDEVAAARRMLAVAEGRVDEQTRATGEVEAQLEAVRLELAERSTQLGIAEAERTEMLARCDEFSRENEQLRESLASIQRILGPVAEASRAAEPGGSSGGDPHVEPAVEAEAGREEALEAESAEPEPDEAPAAEAPPMAAAPVEPEDAEEVGEEPEGGTRQKLLGWMNLSGRKERAEPTPSGTNTPSWTRPGTEREPAPSPAADSSGRASEAQADEAEPTPASARLPRDEPAEPATDTASLAAIAARPTTPIDTCWEDRHLADKLASGDTGDRISFFAGQLERACREAAERTVEVLSFGGAAKFEVAVARRLVDAGHTRFKIRLLTNDAADAARACADAREEGVAGNLEARTAGDAASPAGGSGPWPCFDLVFVPGDLAMARDLDQLLRRGQAQLAERGAFVLASTIQPLPSFRQDAAHAVARRIHEAMPGRYKLDHGPAGAESDGPDAAYEEPDRAREVIPKLLRSELHIDTFVAFGGVSHWLLGPRFGPNFDPKRTSDRRFVDRLVRLDDEKVDAGLARPTRMLAVLRRTPTATPTIPRGWTPEFCMGGPGGPARTASTSPSSQASARSR